MSDDKRNGQIGSNGLSYAEAGVDIDAGNALVTAIKPAVRSTKRPGSDTEIGGFGGLFDLKAAGFDDPILVAANDGVGTKLKIAIEANYHEKVGIDLVAMCVNDLIVQGAEPLFFLDYFATGKLDVEQGKTIIEGIAEGCRQAGAALVGGETAEMPGMYSGGDYDLAGFAVGAAERGSLLPTELAAGDIILGLASSGVHSNGFSLVRKIVELEKISSPTNPGNRISGSESKFQEYDFVIDRRESTKYQVTMPKTTHKSGDKYIRSDTIGGTTVVNHPSCATSKTSVSAFATSTNSKFKKFKIFSCLSNSESGEIGRAHV